MNSRDIIDRLYSVVPVGTYQMQELLSMLDIKLSTSQTSTACITCKLTPTLYINPDFVENNCKSDEHLFMLVMHELYHKILGHTTMFKRHNDIDNIAFDAVINAILCRSFPQEEYISFFKKLNPSNSFPGCLLRPKDIDTPKEFECLLDELYTTNTGTYFDVYNSIIKHCLKNGIKFNYVLIGDHGDKADDIDDELRSVIEKIVERWPRPPKIIEGRDLGSEVSNYHIDYEESNKKERKKLVRFLRLAGIGGNKKEIDSRNINNCLSECISFVPSIKDRTLYVRKALQNDVLMYKDNKYIKAPSDKSKSITYVYLDVSGSVKDDLKFFVPLLINAYKKKECLIFTFSTEVYETSPDDLINGDVKSTGGTNVDCIFEHLFSLPENKAPKKIVILTDGEVGEIKTDYLDEIKRRNIKVFVGLFGERTTDRYLLPITYKMEEFDI